MKDTQELRTFLTDQMTAAANGEFEAVRAKAVGNLAQQIYNTLNIEIKMALAINKLDGKQVPPVSFNG